MHGEACEDQGTFCGNQDFDSVRALRCFVHQDYGNESAHARALPRVPQGLELGVARCMRQNRGQLGQLLSFLRTKVHEEQN